LLVPGGNGSIRGTNRRKSPRRWIYRAAAVFCGAVKKPIPCEIVDLSDSGARLIIALRLLVELPDTFTLALFDDGGVYRDCMVVWD
jgi:hypothetical protein